MQLGPVPIVYVTDTWPLEGGGGAEKVLFSLAIGLDRARFRPFVLSVVGDGSSGYFRLAEEAGVPTAVLSTSLSAGPLGASANFARLVALLRHHQIRIVHGSQDRGVGVLAGVAAGIPVRLHTTHSLLRPPISRLDTVGRCMTAHLVSMNIAVSDAVARDICSRYSVPRSRVTVLPNGVAEAAPSTKDTTADVDALARGQRPTILVVARLVREKGIDILLEAMTHVVAVEPRAILTIVGDGPERAALERRAEALGLAEHVHFAGYEADPGRWFGTATVFAMPSRSEGMGMAAVEALATSVPVVCSDAGGLAEVIENDHCGIVVAGRKLGATVEVDPAIFAEALLRILAGGELGRRLGENGRRRYEERFTVERCIRRHEELYLAEISRVGKQSRMPRETAGS